MKVMAIVAHMDDAEIYCGGTLIKCVARGDQVTVCVVTNGDKGSFQYSREELTAVRRREQRKASGLMKAEELVFFDYEDGMLLDSPALRRNLTETMRRTAPDVVITHYPGDGSNDHSVTGQAVTKSLITLTWPNTSSDTLPMKKMPQLFYMDTAGGIGFMPDFYVDISEVIDDKKAAFLCHESQAECDPNYLETIEVLSRFRGFQAGFRYGEGFIGHQFFGSMADCRILP